MKRITLFCIILCGIYFICGSIYAVAETSCDFAIIQPGQPGDSAAAQPVMDALATYLQQRLPATKISGHYYNHTEDAMSALAAKRPCWAIVSLGLFMEQGGDLGMAPIAATRPSAAAVEQFYLLVAKEQQDDWRQLQGRVEGTALFQRQAVAKLLFDNEPQQLPFDLQGTFNPLRAVRKVTRGQLAGVVLDQLQFQAMQSLPLIDKLKIIRCSGPLPTAAVVWLGESNEQTKELVAVLRGMAADPEAGGLLALLQSEGFDPVDPRLMGYRSLLP